MIRLPVLALALAAVPIPAQNLVVNGDFEGGTTAGWSLTSAPPGSTALPFVSTYEVNGRVLSPALTFVPDILDGTTYDINQSVAVVSGQPYELSYDVAASVQSIMPGNIIVYLLVGPVAAIGPTFSATGSTTGSTKLHNKTILFPSTSSLQISIVITGVSLPAPGGAMVGFVDNIVLQPARIPVVFHSLQLVENKNFTTSVSGTPSSIVGLLASTKLAVTPSTFGGLSGALALDLSSTTLVATDVLDAYGQRTINTWVPSLPTLVGVPLHWQLLELDPLSGTGGFSSSEMIAIQ